MIGFKEFMLAEMARPNIETNKTAIVKRLSREGWNTEDNNKHMKIKHPTKPGIIILPNHKDISIGVARQVHKVAGWI